MSEVAIRVENLSKRYQIGAKKSGSFRETLTNAFRRKREAEAEATEFWALRDVSFEIKRGEAVGIIGKNGAGKSTLLKVLSRITEPTHGRIEINGRVASLLEVGTGFHPELTGRENIYMNGTILGMTRREIRFKLNEIIDFSGVEKFIDTPVKRYSSGMYVRLAFAVAAHLEPEILIIDEVLAVGDAEFQKKCLGKMGEVAGQGRTVLFVSHDIQAVSKLVSTCIYMNQGCIIENGEKSKVINNYLADSANQNSIAVYNNLELLEAPTINFVELETSLPGNFHESRKPLTVRLKFHLPYDIKKTCITVQVVDNRGINCLDFSFFDDSQTCSTKGFYELKCYFPDFRLYMGKYSLTVYFAEPPNGRFFQKIEKICSFEVTIYEKLRGDWEWRPHMTTYLEDYTWSINKHDKLPNKRFSII